MPVLPLAGHPVGLPLRVNALALLDAAPISLPLRVARRDTWTLSPVLVPLRLNGRHFLAADPMGVDVELEGYYAPPVPVVTPPAAVGDVVIIKSNATFPAPTLGPFGRPS